MTPEFDQPTSAELSVVRSNREALLTVGAEVAQRLLEFFPIDPETGRAAQIPVDTFGSYNAQETLEGLDLLEALGGSNALAGLHIDRTQLHDARTALLVLVNTDNS
ncbi:MAG TPA: hypothetical protein VLF90_03040 [Patescibacteria group bacterium]|nr:hypothetical protein [Patescibacteria group bacterium]